jgi:hypothetical protein
MGRLVLAAAILASSVAVCGVASAAPVNAKNAFPITIFCPSGTYDAVINGNGNFTAAHAVNSNQVLIPVVFGPFTSTFTDANGISVTTTDSGSTKGSSMPPNGALQDCTYSVSLSFQDGSTFSGFGSVTGFVTPVR